MRNRCPKFGFLTQLDTNQTDSGQMNLLLVRTLRTCRRPRLRGSTVVDGDAFGKFDGVGESDFRNGLRLEGGQWVK